MEISSLPCCYFSTRVMLKTFSENLSFHIPAETVLYDDPWKALTFLNHYRPQITENYWLKPDNSSEVADGSYTQPLTIIQIHKLRFLYICSMLSNNIMML